MITIIMNPTIPTAMYWTLFGGDDVPSSLMGTGSNPDMLAASSVVTIGTLLSVYNKQRHAHIIVRLY